MDYRQFESMSTAVPNLYRNSGVLRYGGDRKQDRKRTSSRLRRQDLQVRPCLPGSTISEFKFETQLFNSIKVVKQVNNNFIAAVGLTRKKTVLMLMDQHAIHERIRYESLLEDYTVRGSKLFISTKLDMPIVLNDLPMANFKCLLAHSKEVQRYGIRVKSEDMRCLLITSIPECFKRKKLNQSRSELKRNVRELLLEITNDLDWNYANMPTVIHQAIATEACHGAIRFGEQLDSVQCTKLVRSLMHTKAPSRCAHGRPSIIPLLEFKKAEEDLQLISRNKLNFAALKRSRKVVKRGISMKR